MTQDALDRLSRGVDRFGWVHGKTGEITRDLAVADGWQREGASVDPIIRLADVMDTAMAAVKLFDALRDAALHGMAFAFHAGVLRTSHGESVAYDPADPQSAVAALIGIISDYAAHAADAAELHDIAATRFEDDSAERHDAEWRYVTDQPPPSPARQEASISLEHAAWWSTRKGAFCLTIPGDVPCVEAIPFEGQGEARDYFLTKDQLAAIASSANQLLAEAERLEAQAAKPVVMKR